MNKLNKGFTLVELITAMAVYSILLVIISASVVNVAKLYNQVTRRTAYEEALFIEGIITELWDRNNGEIIFKDDSLLEVNGNRLYFESNTLYYSNPSISEVSKHEGILEIRRIINNEKVVYEIVMEDSVKRIILNNLMGNINEE